MIAIDEYGERKEQNGIKKGIEKEREEIILNFYNSGMKPEEIAEKSKRDLKTIKEIINKSEQDKH